MPRLRSRDPAPESSNPGNRHRDFPDRPDADGGAMPSAEHEAVVESMKQQQGGAAPTSIDEMRAGLDALVDYFRALDFPEGVAQTEAVASGVPGFWFTPKAARADGAILYLHGGGYVMGSVATHR